DEDTYRSYQYESVQSYRLRLEEFMSLTKMRRKMSKAIAPTLWLFAGIFVLSCFTWYWPSLSGRNSVRSDTDEPIIARVNGEGVRRDLYERAVQVANRQMELEAQIRKGPTGKPMKLDLRTYHLGRGRAFEQLVEAFLMAQAAEKEGIRVSNHEVQAKID